MSSNATQDIWPNFLVIGAPKSGTTSLYHYLAQHKDIFLSPVRKEGRFFSGIGEGEVYWPAYYHYDTAPTVADYQTLFETWSGQKRIGDVSPDYYAYAPISAPRALKYCGPQTRIIALLRNPVERTYSHYLQNVRRDAEFATFRSALADEPRRKAANWGFQWLYADTSCYAERIAIWKQHFPDMLVLLQDELDADTPGIVAKVQDYLGLDRIEPETRQRYNTGGIPRSRLPILEGVLDARSKEPFEDLYAEFIAPRDATNADAPTADGVYPPMVDGETTVPPMDADIRDALTARFAPEIERLEGLLGRSLEVWRS
ncbi:sulfotransferase domain-containing protein [Maricaulis parjimensis]|uniref:sulfotransferase domain-containing protein n=1 Tax=Maricaulis parjimensis TaxID=144023 RepID=UPI00193A8495